MEHTPNPLCPSADIPPCLCHLYFITPPFIPCRPPTEKWRLKIEKRILSTRLLATAEYEEEKDLINTVMYLRFINSATEYFFYRLE